MVTAAPGPARSLEGSLHEVVVVGGGPAGLAAAIVAGELGASVLVVERREMPADKACGEGLLPPAVRALDHLGVLDLIAPADRRAFTGIRFVQRDAACARLPLPTRGLGVRRTVLVDAMARRARALGVTIADRTAVRAVQRNADGAVVRTERGDVGARLVIAADGLHSSQRHAAHLQAPPSTHHRFAVRRHFGVRPWSEDVEVYVDDLGEAVVTPVGGDTINVNLVWEADDEGGPASFDGLEQRFPVLHARLRGAPVLSTLRGAGPMERRAIRRTCERMLLIGDAGGFIDSIAADGLSMAFNAALVLREILPEILASDADVESLARYEREARRLFRSYRVVTGSLLWIARRPRVRRALIGFLGRHEAVGDAMMSGAMRLMLANVRA